MDSDILKIYKKEAQHFYANFDDPDLGGKNAIRIDLPSVESFFGKPWDEAIKDIDGYGLHPSKQKYNYYRDKGYYSMPAKLENLEQIIRRKSNGKIKEKDKLYPEDLFDEIESNPLYYKDEIDWIKVQIKRSVQGYWCFINGKPTYIDGWHYTYLNWWGVENENRRDRLPDYRDVDRRIFLFFRWAYTTRTAHFNYQLTYRKGGEYKIRYFNNDMAAKRFVALEKCVSYIIDDNDMNGYDVEMPHRTVYGVVFPKRRRVGATFMGSHVGFRIASDTSLGTFAIQALTEETATDDVYKKKILASWKNYPFFFKPCSNGNDTNALVFTKRDKTTFSGDIAQHGGWIRPRSSANKAFDGNKLFAYLNDESGKKTSGDVFHEFTDTIKNALAQGQDIHGFALYTSTFGEFESGGGKEYFELCRKSYSHKRNDNGVTASGLVTLFIPAYDGLDGYVDEFGYSVIEDPDKPFVDLKGNLKDEGAKTYLKRERAYLEENKDWNTLNNVVRNNPFTLREAGSRATRSNYWDISVLRDSISRLKFGESQVRGVNLRWENDERWTQVVIEEPTIDKPPKFFLSLPPSEQLRNKFVFDEMLGERGAYRPASEVMGKYILGCDPFSFDNKDTTGKKKSNGGGAVYMLTDNTVDTKEKLYIEHVTGDFCLTYNNRVETTEEYCEDMLMVAVFFGAMVYTERNVGHVLKYFRQNNADGFLLHTIDPITGKPDPVAGIRTDKAVHEKIFSKYADYVKAVGKRARHLEILEEIQEVQSPEDMTNYDLFAAGGMALLGAESKYPTLMKSNEDVNDISGFIEIYD